MAYYKLQTADNPEVKDLVPAKRAQQVISLRERQMSG